MLVKLLDSGSEVGSSLVLDETLTARASGITLTVDLTVDNVQSRLAREVLEVLGMKLANVLSTNGKAKTLWMPRSICMYFQKAASLEEYIPAS